MLRLILKQQPKVPLEAEVITPDRLCGVSKQEVEEQNVQYGRRQRKLRDFFDVEIVTQLEDTSSWESPSEADSGQTIEVIGDLARVKRLGEGMTQGTLLIRGSVGMHLGALMRGGLIRVEGDCDAWAGTEMKGGRISISGNAGDQLGAAYRGSLTGMRGGLIEVRGSAGVELGRLMRRGTIVVGGIAGESSGLQMRGGTIVLKNGAEIRPGVMMRRGTIFSLQPLQILPTWRASGEFAADKHDVSILNFLTGYLKTMRIDLPGDFGQLHRFRGDPMLAGRGEIICPVEDSPLTA